jgi:hypothetical protein
MWISKATLSGSDFSFVARSAAVFMVLVAAVPAAAQTSNQDADQATALPAAQVLVERHVKLVNADAIIAHGSFRTVSEFSMPSLGMSGKIHVVGAAPGRMMMTMTLPGLGEIASGFDGTTGWSMNPMEGPRLMSEAELSQVRDEADFEANIRSSRLIESMQTVERAEFGGNACWKVRLLWKSGRETFDCYDIETGFLIATMMQTQTAMGAVASTIMFDEYTDYHGVLMPRVSRQQAFGQEMTVTLESIEFGGVDATAFELPDAIRALVGK